MNAPLQLYGLLCARIIHKIEWNESSTVQEGVALNIHSASNELRSNLYRGSKQLMLGFTKSNCYKVEPFCISYINAIMLFLKEVDLLDKI